MSGVNHRPDRRDRPSRSGADGIDQRKGSSPAFAIVGGGIDFDEGALRLGRKDSRQRPSSRQSVAV